MKSRISLAIFYLLLSPIAHAQWIRTTGPGDVLSFAATSDALFAGVKGGLFVTTDNGATWQKDGFDTDWVQALIVQNNTIFVGTNLHGIFASSDDGEHWINVTNGIADTVGIYCFSICGSNILAGTEYGIFISRDNGESWRQTNVHQLTHPIASDGSNACAVSGLTSFYYSTDQGSNWMRMGPMPSFSYALMMMGDYIFSPGPKLGVLRSQFRGDSGSWILVDSGLNVSTKFTGHSFAVSGNLLFLGASEGIYMTSDSGRQWWDETDGATDTAGNPLYGNALIVWNDRLWVAGADSVWYRPLSEITVPSSVPIQRSQNELSVYPNPMSNQGTISLSLPSERYVDVSITNLLGETVSNIFSGLANHENMSFAWDAHLYPAGVYECIIRTKDGLRSIPIIVAH